MTDLIHISDTKRFTARRILVADDEGQITFLLERLLLKKFGCTVITVTSGDEALLALEDERFDVFITDMMMPGRHGVELVAEVATRCPDMDIVVMTAYPVDFPYVEVTEAGACEIIHKPFPEKEMAAKLLRLFKERELRERLEEDKKRILADMESMKRMRDAQAIAEWKYHTLFELSMTGMLVADPKTFIIRDVNRAFCELSGRSDKDLCDSPLLEIISDGERARVELALTHFADNGSGTLAGITITTSVESVRFVDVNVTFIEQAQEAMVLLAFNDVTEQRELQRQLAESAYTDSLTGLYNQRAFQTRLKGAISSAIRDCVPLSLLFIDLDNFKNCNDTHGHQVGDELLALIGRVVHAEIRGGDQGFRYGGDEFAVVLSGSDVDGATSVTERIRDAFMLQETYGTSMSIGIAQFQPGMDSATLVRVADEALYKAKFAGKNTIHIAESE
jgi:diguanylate cyclase (GGDEF)-like protein/PAS domain S-box-containing protein